MSFVRNSFTKVHRSLLPLLSLFLLFWLAGGTLLGLQALSLKSLIAEQRLDDLDKSLSQYLAQNNSSRGLHFRLQATPPDGMDFIHINYGHDQVLITGNKSLQPTGVLDLASTAEGAWLDLQNPNKSGEWLVVRKELPDGTIIQAGRNDLSVGLAIYGRATSNAILLFLLATLPSLGLALLTLHIIRTPLRRLAEGIKGASSLQALKVQTHFMQHQELSHINSLLERTFSQNRQLISEMQSSLDNVAHDLRTPMTRLRGVAEYALQSDRVDPALYRSALSDCLEESERVLSMLKTMMSVAEAEAGTMRLNLTELNVKETLDDVLGLYQYVAEEAEIEVYCHTDSPKTTILADKTRICQVWANLLDNAIKYGHKNGSVDISIETQDDQALIRFCDDGMGISATEIKRIWDRLYRGDRSRSMQGLGLGLNYVQAVVAAHGGEVTVVSQIKTGSCFEVRLPRIISGEIKVTDKGCVI